MSTGTASPDMQAVGIGYTLATGRLFCDMTTFHAFAEDLLNDSIWTDEFADEATWKRLRTAFEEQVASEAPPPAAL